MSMVNSLIAIVEGGKPLKMDLSSVIESASKNKVLLHVLRVLDFQGSLREEQELRMRRIIQVVQTLSALLKGYDYAFFKLVKPVVYVPADVDILIDFRQVRGAVKEVVRLGYRVVVWDPYCVTLVRAGSIVDLYTYPSLGGVVFLDGQKLLEYVVVGDFDGVEVRVLEGCVEALVAASHAIFKERIYTLNDYFTVGKWVTRKTLELAWELGCEDAVKIAMDLNRKISRGLLETPYKIPVSLWLTVLIRKFQKDGLTRVTSMNMLKALTSGRAGKLLMSKFVRETY